MAESRHSSSGFSLVEVLVATALLATGLLAAAQLFAIATDANRRSRVETTAAILAEQKMEQLRGLTFGFDPFMPGFALTDTSSNICVTPPTATGGSGLTPSPPGSLSSNTPGFVDYLDAMGAWVGTGGSMPSGAVYIRRWSIEPMPINPNNTLVFQVLVTRWSNRGDAGGGSVRRLPEEARLISVKTRKAQ